MVRLSESLLERLRDIVEVEPSEIPRFKTYLAGEWVDSKEYSNVYSPIDESIIARISKLSPEMIESVIEKIYRSGRWSARNLPG
ncbi:MAG: NADP-dependent glyceraldehyde-3-phosphate dehydrogenase, partial [Sulfolobales archaeon]